LDLDISNLQALTDGHRGRLLAFQGDVRDVEAVSAAVDAACARFSSVDIAVHNACLCPFRSFAEQSNDDFRAVLDVNLFGAINMTRAVLPAMTAQGRGKVCFTSSGVGVTGFVNVSPYSSSKGAIEALAKCLSLEYAGSGITFHIIHPPLTDTKSASPLLVPNEFKASPEKVGRRLARSIKGGRFVMSPSFGTSVSVALSYLFPTAVGRLLVKMAARSAARG
jgi:NAD(P)-dependent dehydrogenase (short-subunit alcohol dehydrogenase family)